MYIKIYSTIIHSKIASTINYCTKNIAISVFFYCTIKKLHLQVKSIVICVVTLYKVSLCNTRVYEKNNIIFVNIIIE